MKLVKYIDRINLLHKLIDRAKTGNSAELAKRLGVSQSRLFQIIEELKLLGAPIAYCRQRETYHYSKPYFIGATLTMRDLND